MKKNILIYGTGNIALRHVESLILEKTINKIYLYDFNERSLSKARSYLKKKDLKNKLVYSNSIKNINLINFFLIIVCTYAYNRIKLIKLINNHFKFKFLITEKILETNILNFNKINFNHKNIYVNFPLRVMKLFKIAKSKLKSKIINAKVYGGDWHMLCNALHYINFTGFLCKSSIKNLNFKSLHSKYNLKRKGFVDYHGEINLLYKNGSTLNILSNKREKKYYFELISGKKKIKLNLNNYSILENKKISKIKKDYQSNLTRKYYQSLLKNNKVNLPKMNEVLEENFLFLEALKNITKDKHIYKKIT